MTKHRPADRPPLAESKRKAQSLTSAIFLLSDRDRISSAAQLSQDIYQLMADKRELLSREWHETTEQRNELVRQMLLSLFHSINIDISGHRNRRDATFDLLAGIFDILKKEQVKKFEVSQSDNIISWVEDKAIRRDFLHSLINLLTEEYNESYSENGRLAASEPAQSAKQKDNNTGACELRSVVFDSERQMFDFGKAVLSKDLNANISFVGGTRVEIGEDFLADDRFISVREKFRLASRFIEKQGEDEAQTEYEPIDLDDLSIEADEKFAELMRRYPQP